MTQTIDFLKQIIAIPSYVDENHDESSLVDFIVNKLKQNSELKVTEQPVEKNRRNLIVSDSHDPKIILFGHMDTVPPKQQETNPLAPYEEGGKLYGLGSVDMKSGLAIMLDIALNHHKKGTGYIFSVDEEYDFKGASKLKEIDYIHPKFIINLEPTSFKIINGCRGIAEFEIEIYGKSAHAGRKSNGVNAIEETVKLFSKFETECQKSDQGDASTSVNLAYLHGGLKSDDTSDVKRMGNVVPNYARAVVEIRIANTKITQSYIEETINHLSKEIGLQIRNLKFKFFFGSMLTPKDDLKLFEKVISTSGFTSEYADINQAGYFELQMLQSKWGGSAVIFGPGPSEKSHTENEYVEIDSVSTTQKVIEKFLANSLN